MGNLVSLSQKDKVIDIQEEYINRLYKNKDYETCYASCDYLLSLLPKDSDDQKRVKRFCYLRQAVCKNKLGEYEIAMQKADIAAGYCNKDDYYSIIYMKALIYMKLNNSKSALIHLNKCIKWYLRNKMHYELGMAYEAKGKLLRSEEYYFKAFTEYEAAYSEDNYYDLEMFLAEFDRAYQNLVEEVYLYIGEQNMIKAYSAMKNIKSEQIRKETKEMIKKLYRKEV